MTTTLPKPKRVGSKEVIKRHGKGDTLIKSVTHYYNGGLEREIYGVFDLSGAIFHSCVMWNDANDPEWEFSQSLHPKHEWLLRSA